MEFRDKYKDDLTQGNLSRNFNFTEDFKTLLKIAEDNVRKEAQKPKVMKSFEESQKSKKTVASMIENKKETPKSVKEQKKKAAEAVKAKAAEPTTVSNGTLDEETIRKNIEKKFGLNKKPKAEKAKTESPDANKKKGKQARKWDKGGTTKEMRELDFSAANGDGDKDKDRDLDETLPTEEDLAMLGSMSGNLGDLEEESSDEEESEEEEEEDTPVQQKSAGKSKGFGMFNVFKGLVGSKTLTRDDIQDVLNKMRDHLISKNVAADIAAKLCDSVATKLEGKVLGTFNTVASTVRNTLQEACVQLLSPKRRIDILRDAMEAKQQNRPYTIVFCGVNGVGKSTNLAKVSFWLVENGFRVLIAACDTFRAGAVEQLRTHTRKLNALHPPTKHNGMQMVQLYEQGYGKDAAGIAMQAVNYARDYKLDVTLIDTAGRMQDNEPLMRALAKLIKVNQPDLVLFVGEALVGNEAVDQLTKFNQALADHSQMENPRLIDGIVLTKFDTIDDKVGAAVSMTYITGQPIVFVGTGQTYTDLKNLNAKAVVSALLK
ncbi:signal recognition particle receptor subunit alpha homolog [Lingula anatina]|uniref:Signal recognition particle receptor subunit alpha homolog n=1 Tax=Lingula anatina TaxID=7574 RepID=A0A2R2MQ45_LINAN|nr:signal recognition particle receptor subunit alpha homolog [Lingula anatina]|eukprot:XP_023932356.1 signal recognition particle receptor subunit alpha homolog [Lingula anatina]